MWYNTWHGVVGYGTAWSGLLIGMTPLVDRFYGPCKASRAVPRTSEGLIDCRVVVMDYSTVDRSKRAADAHLRHVRRLSHI